MRIQYFHDTDTLYLVLNSNIVAETQDLDENTLVDLDEEGQVVSITFEHASQRTDIASLTFQQVAAPIPA
jgi:uncharacterized protein YuzE